MQDRRGHSHQAPSVWSWQRHVKNDVEHLFHMLIIKGILKEYMIQGNHDNIIQYVELTSASSSPPYLLHVKEMSIDFIQIKKGT